MDDTARLPASHELRVVVLSESRYENVTFWPKAGVRVGDRGIGAHREGRKPDAQLAGCEFRRDLDHLDEARVWFMARDEPDGIMRSCHRDEDAIRLCDS